MIERLKLSDLNRKSWEDLLAACPAATFFQTFEWSQIWQESFPFFESFFLVEKASDGSYLAGLPFVKAKKLLSGYYSMPMGTYGGAVGRPGVPLTPLYRHWMEATAGLKREHLMVTSPFVIPELGSLGFKVRKLATRLAEKPAGGWKKMWSSKTRNEMKYAQNSGLILRFLTGEEEARQCLVLAGRKRKNRFYTETFYCKLSEHLASTGRLIWPLAYQGEELVAFQVRFLFKGELFFWDSAFDSRFSKMRPGYFLFHHLFERAEKEGVQRINFGATPKEAPGVAFFKSRLGGKEVPVFEYTFAPILKRAARRAFEKLRGKK